MKDKKPYLFIGLAMVIGSANPASVILSSQLEIVRFSLDMTLIWGAGLIGIWIADYFFRTGKAKKFLSFNFTTRGLVLAWGIAGTTISYWYFPRTIRRFCNRTFNEDASNSYVCSSRHCGRNSWYGMTNVWKSISMFSLFSMMASMAEIFLELGTYFSTNLYTSYSIQQFTDTAYFLFAMAFAPSTFTWLNG